jgi:hypothetical protein
MLTPEKAVKGQTEQKKQLNMAADDLCSKAVSTVLQPAAAFINLIF